MYIGVPHDKLVGETCKDRLATVDRMTYDEFLRLAQVSGFVYKSLVGGAVVIPPRFVVLNVAITQAAHGIRWQLLGSQHNISETEQLMVTAILENPSLVKHLKVKCLCTKLASRFADA